MAIILLTLSIITDTKDHIIKNSIILPFIISGLIINLSIGGLKSLVGSVAGILLPFAALYLLFCLRMLGAGDIKLLCTLGAILGTGPIISISILSFLSGAFMAMLLMIARKNIFERINHLWNYLKSCLLTLRLQPYSDYFLIKSNAFFNFSYAIAFGTILYFLAKYYGIIIIDL
jgi:prepilin peptidase CpaA